MTAKEKAKDRRLRKTYGWTLEMYNALGELQEWKCPCGRALTTHANLDHLHLHIVSYRITKNHAIPSFANKAKWYTTVREFPDIQVWGLTKQGGIDTARCVALPRSVRGLMCHGRHGRAGSGSCNRLLGRVDNQEWLRRMADYLDDPPARKIIANVKP